MIKSLQKRGEFFFFPGIIKVTIYTVSKSIELIKCALNATVLSGTKVNKQLKNDGTGYAIFTIHEFTIKTSAETNECRSRSRLLCEYQNIDFWLENYANAFSQNL